MKRLVVGLIGGSLTVALILAGPPRGVVVLAGLALGLAALEYARVAKRWCPGFALAPWLVLTLTALAAALVWGGWTAVAPEVLVLGLAGLLVVSGAMVTLTRVSPQEGFPAVAAFVFGVGYLGGPLVAIDALVRRDPRLVLILVALVWIGDSAAYYVGRTWGRHLLAPVLSPKKTWEGAVASSVFGVGVAAALTMLLFGEIGLSSLIVLVVVSVVAQIGDLFESLMKRGANIKDSGGILPGHGGMLDRLDALLLAAPVYGLFVVMTRPLP